LQRSQRCQQQGSERCESVHEAFFIDAFIWRLPSARRRPAR
jgi:hypothetical protein